MKVHLKASPLALAVAAAFALSAPVAWAGGGYSDNANVATNVNMNKSLTVQGTINVGRNGGGYAIDPGADAEALVQGDQFSVHNSSANNYQQNDATVNSSVLNGASGNIGTNVAAGNDNIQSNELAMAVQDATDVFGAGTAQVMFDQGAYGNTAGAQDGIDPNDASLSNDVLNGASGNIGVNLAAGDSNVQRNGVALATGNNNLAIATVSTAQKNAGNDTSNQGYVTSYGTATMTYGDSVTGGKTLDGSFTASGYFAKAGQGSGAGGGQWASSGSSSDASSNSGTASATTIASGNGTARSHSVAGIDGISVGAGSHGNGSASSSASNLTQVATATSDQGASSGSHWWQYSKTKSFYATGSIQAANNWTLSQTCTHTVPVPMTVAWSTNDATLGNNVLNGASGNVGVNIAAGANNLQENVMAAAETPK